MSIILPNADATGPNPNYSPLEEEVHPDGSVRLVHRGGAFIAFSMDGTFMLQDAYGSTIATNPAGNMLIKPAKGLLINSDQAWLKQGDEPSVSILDLLKLVKTT